jgi:hypothetical protein
VARARIDVMRTVVLGTFVLALGSGCNWVFGLDPVTLTDAQIIDSQPDARLPTVKLSAITPMLTGAGAITGQATFTTITPAPMVQYGPIGGALVDTTYTADQEVPVGYDFAESGTPWRLVYTLAGGVPHELHWKPSVTAHPGHAVELQLTPNDRVAVPGGAKFQLDAATPPTAWVEPRVYTTNTWTATVSTQVGVDVSFPDRVTANYDDTVLTKAIAGAKRTPDPVKDYEVLLDYDLSLADARCTVVKGSAAFRIDLATGTSTDAGAPMYKADPKPGNYVVQTGNPLGIAATIAGANGILNLPSIARYQVITYGPGGAIPLHHQTEKDIPLPVPVGIPLAKCTNGPDTLPTFGYPSRVALGTIGTLMFTTPSMPLAEGGASVVNGVEISIVGDQGPFNMNYTAAAIPVNATIDGVMVDIKNTATAAIPAGAATAELDFEFTDLPANVIVDLFEATLYRVSGGALIPVREFTFTEKPLRFDRDQGLAANTLYVFQIRAIRGASANTVGADFSVWGNTQTLAVTNTNTFTLAH